MCVCVCMCVCVVVFVFVFCLFFLILMAMLLLEFTVYAHSSPISIVHPCFSAIVQIAKWRSLKDPMAENISESFARSVWNWKIGCFPRLNGIPNCKCHPKVEKNWTWKQWFRIKRKLPERKKKKKTWQVWIHSRGDLNFCVRSNRLRWQMSPRHPPPPPKIKINK